MPFGFIHVVYSDVEMHLLRWVGVRPARRPKLGRQLEREARPVGRVADDNPVVVVVYPDEAEEFLVERCEAAGVGRVDNKAAPVAGHKEEYRILPEGPPQLSYACEEHASSVTVGDRFAGRHFDVWEVTNVTRLSEKVVVDP